MPLHFTHLKTNGIRLHVAQAGDPGAPLVILLHGFPEFWFGWRGQIDPLVAAGYQVWAPDQRGFNLSDKPTSLDDYRLDTLAQDVLGLIAASGQEQVHLVGHDWGAGVAWWLANHYPEKLRRLVILNAPHHQAFRDTLAHSWRQRRLSWYFLFFQLPSLPERVLSAGQFQQFAAGIRQSARRGSFTEADMAHYKEAWRQPGALTGMINWYRAIVRRQPTFPADPTSRVPTLIIWGRRDQALVPELAERSLAFCPEGRLEMIDEATHWVQHDARERVNQLLLEFLG